MKFKVRLFYDGKEVKPSDLIINNISVDRIVNEVVDRHNFLLDLQDEDEIDPDV